MATALAQKIAVYISPTEPVWLLWSVREVSTAILVGNLVFCQPLLRKTQDSFFAIKASVGSHLRSHRQVGSQRPDKASALDTGNVSSKQTIQTTIC